MIHLSIMEGWKPGKMIQISLALVNTGVENVLNYVEMKGTHLLKRVG